MLTWAVARLTVRGNGDNALLIIVAIGADCFIAAVASFCYARS